VVEVTKKKTVEQPSAQASTSEPAKTSNGVLFQNGNAINQSLISVVTSPTNTSSSSYICYDSDTKIYIATETTIGSLKVKLNRQGTSPTIIIEKGKHSMLEKFRSAVEAHLKKSIKYYTRNQHASYVSVFLTTKRENDGDVFPVKVNGEEKLLSVKELSNLRGAYRVVVKVGGLRDSNADTSAYVWSLAATELIIDTTVEVPAESTFKFASQIDIC
jgi:hypothetical protein